jgi:hypothetical protein
MSPAARLVLAARAAKTVSTVSATILIPRIRMASSFHNSSRHRFRETASSRTPPAADASLMIAEGKVFFSFLV